MEIIKNHKVNGKMQTDAFAAHDADTRIEIIKLLKQHTCRVRCQQSHKMWSTGESGVWGTRISKAKMRMHSKAS